MSYFQQRCYGGILTHNEYGISKVIDLKQIKGLGFSQEIYQQAKDILEKENYIALFNGSIQDEKKEEYLLIMSFKNEENKSFIVTVYDNDELWQDPQIIDIFPVIKVENL